ncbi:MAG: hypothetical protein ACK5Q5_15325 [Planctomycetaceae bacterium]
MRFVMVLGLLAVLAATAGLWLLPIEFFQGENVGRAGPDPYAQFEAAGQAEFLVWTGRTLLPLLAITGACGILQGPSLEAFLRSAFRGWLSATTIDPAASHTDLAGWRTLLLRAGGLLWIGLFSWHAVHGLLDRGRDWAYFRLNTGAQVLPNMSFENRAVIRYLQQATPEDAKILVCSDQSVFFLSYYLRPRQLFHVVHPDSEFVIPQAGQSRPLAAYRWDNLPLSEIEAIQPDYVLEYYEGPNYVDRARLAEDLAWVRFWRQSQQQTGTPPYLVNLMPWADAVNRRRDLSAIEARRD